VDVLWHALLLAKNKLQRLWGERDGTISRMNENRVPPQLPTEIILQIVGHIRWDGRVPFAPTGPRLSDVRGTEDAIWRTFPLVILISERATKETNIAKSLREDYTLGEWTGIFKNLPSSQREIVGKFPRLSGFNNKDALSRIAPDEEVQIFINLNVLIPRTLLARSKGSPGSCIFCS